MALPTHIQNTENRRRFKANLPAMQSRPDENRSRQENSLRHGPQRILECVPFSEHPCTSMISAISSHKNCFRFSPTILLALDRRRNQNREQNRSRTREGEEATGKRERASAMQLPLLQQTDFPREKKRKKKKNPKIKMQRSKNQKLN